MKLQQLALTFLLFISCAGTLWAEGSALELEQPSGFQWASALRQSVAFLAAKMMLSQAIGRKY